MKHYIYLTFFAVLFVVTACKKESEIYTIYRPTNENNFKTAQGSELYAFAATDLVLVRADYYVKMMGSLKTYGSQIVAYGFCWGTSPLPYIGNDTIIKSPLPKAVDSTSWFTFNSPINNLVPDQDYYIRSFVITLNNNTPPDSIIWYNPDVILVRTKIAIDEWKQQAGNPTGGIYNGLAFNFGDTVFYGTGEKGSDFLSNALYLYNHRKSQWEDMPTIGAIRLPNSNETLSAFTDGIGFSIQFSDNPGPTGNRRKFIYVGLGDYRGRDKVLDKSNTLLAFNLDDPTAGWVETRDLLDSRSSAVCFVLGEYAYIGTGSNSAPLSDWYYFSPVKERDNIGSTPAYERLESFPEIKRVGAVAFSINGRGYFGLGSDGKGNFYNDWWQYTPTGDPRRGRWDRMTPFPGAARANASAFVIGDQGYVGTGDNFKPIVDGTVVDLEKDLPNYTGEMFDDLYRYDPFNNKWYKDLARYTSNKSDRKGISKKVTRAVGFSIPGQSLGFIGYGIDPNDAVSRAQSDLWYYQPFISGSK